jgi:hypothetical protein
MASEGERGCSKLGKMRGGDEEVVVEWMSRGNSAYDILAEEVQGSKSGCASGASKEGRGG